MILINKKSYRIKRIDDKTDYGMRHISIEVFNNIGNLHKERTTLELHVDDKGEEFQGIILFPYYKPETNTTIFQVYVLDQ